MLLHLSIYLYQDKAKFIHITFRCERNKILGVLGYLSVCSSIMALVHKLNTPHAKNGDKPQIKVRLQPIEAKEEAFKQDLYFMKYHTMLINTKDINLISCFQYHYKQHVTKLISS